MGREYKGKSMSIVSEILINNFTLEAKNCVACSNNNVSIIIVIDIFNQLIFEEELDLARIFSVLFMF